jgi:hypothetical protein
MSFLTIRYSNALNPFSTDATELQGAKVTLECGTQGSFTSFFTSDGFAVVGASLKNSGNEEVAALFYESGGSTFSNPMTFKLTMIAPCEDKILTIDLRTTCSEGEKLVVFDVPTDTLTTPDSGGGNLQVSGGACEDPVPVFLDYNVGVGGNAPLPDLWQTAKFDFGAADCSLETDNVSITIDTDTALDSCTMAPSPAPSAAPVGANGDPHFSTWKGEHYDYHGKCDLELVSDPLFVNGKGLDVHIRTEIVRQWSFIKYAAIRIGNDILEVQGGADDNHYWINKVYQGELTTMAGFPVKYKKANSKQHVYTIDLGDKEEIAISTFKDFVRIDFKEPKKSLYGNTVGLLADFNTGKKLGRDGFTIIEDYNDFGQEWQVLSDGPKLFHEVSGRQFPGQKCVLPAELHAEEERRRGQEKRLGGGTPNTAVTDTIAELACAKISVSEHDACVSDVLITGDVDMAGAY